jgi:hypothetical protein
MAARFELDFEVTPAQRADGNEFLINRAIIERNGLIGRLGRPPLFWLYGAPCTIVIVQNLTRLIGNIIEGRLPEGFGIESMIGYAIALYFLGYEARLMWNWAGRRFGFGGLRLIGRKGVHWGAHRLTATEDELILEREKCRSVYRWPAILGIRESRRALFLMLTDLSAIVVPKTAFATPNLQQSFRDFVDQRIATDP